MNRKIKEKENNQQKEGQQVVKTGEPIPPKFIANWSQNIRFDKIVINICDCQYEVVPKVGKQLKWKVVNNANWAEWDIWWTDWIVAPETLMKMEQHQKINHFPGMMILARKNLMAKGLMKMRKKDLNEYSFFPLTWNLPLQYPQFKAYYESKPKGKARTYIVKPESLSQGKGIYLTRKIQDINPSNHCVVQRYLSKPYLIDGLKFDLRIYVLLAGVDPLKIYIYEEGLARFATQTYVVPNKDNITDIFMHLTNYAINKESQKFVFNEDSQNMTYGHKRSLTSIFQHLKEKGCDVQILKKKINQVIVKTIISGHPHLKFLYRSCQPDNFRGDMCFQILGFDIILSEDLEPLLLQINYTPSFSTDTPLDEKIKKNLIKDTLILVGLDKKFKEATVKERRQLRQQRMLTGKQVKLTQEQKNIRKNLAQNQKNQYMLQNEGGFSRIYPLSPQDPQSEIYARLLSYAQQIFSEGTRVKKDSNNIIENNKKEVNKDICLEKQQGKLPNLPISSIPKQNTTKSSSSNKFSQKRIAIRDKLRNEVGSLCKINLQENKERPQNLSGKIQIQKRQNANIINIHAPIIQELSQKVLNKKKLKQIILTTKKQLRQRQILVPSTIQFQDFKFEGFSENFLLGNHRQQ